LEIDIYRKPTTTDTTIHYNSNHPTEQKLAAYRFLMNRMHQLPITADRKQKETKTILQIAQSHCFL
jgi:hypothetical protein